MKACVYYRPGKISLEDLPKPELNPEDVLIRVEACGICGSDLHLLRPPSNTVKRLKLLVRNMLTKPHKVILGHEISGYVEELGEKVKTGAPVNIGDRVTIYPNITCGLCDFCRIGYENMCASSKAVGRELHGGFAEYVVVPHKNIMKLPTNLSFEEGALIEPLGCALHAVKNTNILSEKIKTSVILGAGTMGLLILQLLRTETEVENVVMTDIYDFKLRLAEELGATMTFNARHVNVSEEIKRKFPSVDAVFECVGGNAAIETLHQAIRVVKPRGKICLVGALTTAVRLRLGEVHSKEITIVSSYASTYKDQLEALTLAAKRKIQLKPLITHRFPLARIREAFREALKGTSIKVVIYPHQAM